VVDPIPSPDEAPLFGPEEPDPGVGFAIVLIEDLVGAEKHARETQRLTVGSEDDVLSGGYAGIAVRHGSSCLMDVWLCS